jgi:ubiquinone/menaquinone biosynthesis C-methylase UbiE
MANLVFEGDMARMQHGFAQCHDSINRRYLVLEALNLRSGERVLEQGCGGGYYTYEMARFVGSEGRVAAIDISADQIAAASNRCREMSWVECQIANATELPYGDGEFDAVLGVQVLEYVQDFENALREAYRLLRQGGRIINLATNWSSLLWHSKHPERMRRVLDLFTAHAPHPDFPVILGPALRKTGFQILRQQGIALVNTSYNENRASFWVSRLAANFARARGASEDETNAWLAEFPDLDAKGDYFFSTTTILTEAVKVH